MARYGHSLLTTACAEPGCTVPAQVADDDDPAVLRCVPHAMARLRECASTSEVV